MPRIDKNLILEYKKDIIVLSGNLYGEIPSKILNIGEKQAEDALLWWKNNFESDFNSGKTMNYDKMKKLLMRSLRSFQKTIK